MLGHTHWVSGLCLGRGGGLSEHGVGFGGGGSGPGMSSVQEGGGGAERGASIVCVHLLA
jgi:hypothetical protein